MEMLDYVKMANDRMREIHLRADALTAPLVQAAIACECKAIRIVACGSSRNAADCARLFMQRTLGMPVLVVTPEAFCSYESTFPKEVFTIAISQSGYSTNTLAALDFARECGMRVAALTANVHAPIREHAESVIDYGVGVESVDFVTMGVSTLIEFLMLFALRLARRIGRINDAELLHGDKDIAAAIGAHAGALVASEAFVAEHRDELSRWTPTFFVGNGPNVGAAQEAALKFCETLKRPAMFYEGEEFVHGPQMQIQPGYAAFIMDDPQGSSRMRNIFQLIRTVSASTFLVTAHPAGEPGELAIPAVPNPLTAPIPLLAPFQYIAASVTKALDCWEVHPYLKAVEREFATKADGYDASVKALEMRAKKQYGDTAGT